MSKPKISIQDVSFPVEDKSTSKFHEPKYFDWDRSCQDTRLVFFTDLCLPLAKLPQYKNSYKIALALEPQVISPHVYQYLLQNKNDFDLILSHHLDFIRQIADKGLYYFNGMSWISSQDWKKYEKTKNISIIASNKAFAIGHQLRHSLIRECPNQFDIFGSGYKTIPYKLEALKDYRYSIAIENCRVDCYATEKLLDCFATYSIPVYWGCPSINKFFNTDGMIICTDLEDMKQKLQLCTEEHYHKPLVQKALQENFEIADKLKVAEDMIWTDILQPRGLV